MMSPDWVEEFPAMVSVCDTEGVILAMNQKEANFYEDQGGKNLIGTNLFDCHNANSGQIIRELMETKKFRVYTVHKNGKRELVVQGPWYQNGTFSGLVEIAVEIEDEILHIER